MAAVLNIDDIVSINLDGRLFGQQILLTTHWRVYSISPGTSADMVAAFAAINTAMAEVGGLADTYASATSEDLTSIQNVFQIIHPVRYVRHILASDFPDGEVAVESSPPNVAHVITLRGDIADRHNISNKHIGAVPTTFTLNGEITAAGIAAMTDLKTALAFPITATVAADTVILNPIIYYRGFPIDSAEITSAYLQGTTRVERRRTVGLGS